MVYNNNNLNNIDNRYITRFKDDVVNHPYIMIFLLLMCIVVIVYFIYKYAISNQTIQGYTYYANEILKLDPLFTETTDNPDACIALCKNYSNCDGITYDSNTGTCLGQQNGRLRTDDDNYSAWVKSTSSNLTKLKTSGNIQSVTNIEPLITNLLSTKYAMIPPKDLPYPPFPDSYSYHFVLNIQDWYVNYSYWRHIFHKGTPIDGSVNNKNKPIQYSNWEEIVNDLPEQTIGCWLSPYQNNLRVAVTTLSKIPHMRTYEHANIEKCKCDNTNTFNVGKDGKIAKNVHCSNCWITDQEGDIEHIEDKSLDLKDFKTIDYIDIQDLQTNIPMEIDISIKGSIIEVYVNGLFRISKILNGNATWNNGSLYLHNPKTYKGSLNDLKIISGSMTGEHVKDLYKSYFK